MQTIPQPRPSPAEDKPYEPRTGLAGIIEYWREGCWKEYGYCWWSALFNAWYWVRRHRLAIVTVR